MNGFLGGMLEAGKVAGGRGDADVSCSYRFELNARAVHRLRILQRVVLIDAYYPLHWECNGI